MTITQALEQRNIKCEDINGYEMELTYKGKKYWMRSILTSGMLFTLYDITEQKTLCTRGSFKTICRLILLGHK